MDVVRSHSQHGWIEVITGSMFSGKSEELIRRLRRAQIAKQKVQIFKPLVDNRYGEDHIVSHSDMRIASQCVKDSDELVTRVDDDTEVVGIDEGQFFDACKWPEPAGGSRQARHRRWPRSGLPRPVFEPMPQLLAIAGIIKTYAPASSAAIRLTTHSGWWQRSRAGRRDRAA